MDNGNIVVEEQQVVETETEEVVANNDEPGITLPLPLIGLGALGIVATGGLSFLGYKIWEKKVHPERYYDKKQARLEKKAAKAVEKAAKNLEKLDSVLATFEDDVVETEVVEAEVVKTE